MLLSFRDKAISISTFTRQVFTGLYPSISFASVEFLSLVHTGLMSWTLVATTSYIYGASTPLDHKNGIPANSQHRTDIP